MSYPIPDEMTLVKICGSTYTFGFLFCKKNNLSQILLAKMLQIYGKVKNLFLKIGFCLQRRNGEDIPVAQTKNINHRRFAASFRLQEVTKTDQDLYRCVTQSERGSGVSNFAQLIVRGKVKLFAFHEIAWLYLNKSICIDILIDF